MADFITGGEIRALSKRGLSEATCRKFGYRIGVNHADEPVQIADYRDSAGLLVAQKLRKADKTFSVIRDKSQPWPLFGQHLAETGGKRLVITEGEIDAMSVAQAFNLSWPVVSLPNGAASAAKAIRDQWQFVSAFETVVLCFDMDEPGRAAAEEVAVLLPPGKCRIAELPRKDANDCLLAGEIKAITGAIYNAREYRPDGIVSMSDIRSRVLEPPAVGMPWFLPQLNVHTYGRHEGGLYALGAGTGVGKTDFLTQQIAFDVLNLGLTVGCIYLEQPVGETGKRIAGKTVGRKFHIPGAFDQAELENAWDRLEATNRLFLYEHFGAMDWKTVKSRMEYMIVGIGCKIVYLDHLTALAAAEEDERRALELIMSEMASMAQRHGAVIIFVSHLATPDGTPHEEGGRVMIRHFKGSRAIGFWSHVMLGLERNQQAEDEADQTRTTVRLLKDRLAGAAGRTIVLDYDGETGMLREAPKPEDLLGAPGDDRPDF